MMGPVAQDRATGVGREAGGLRADLPWLAILVVAAVALRGWQLTHTEVASRDSIGYIRIAWRLEHQPWGPVLRSSLQHPGYPLALLAVSHPLRRLLHGDLAYLMQLSAQLTSALASVLLVVPTFYLGRELFGRRIGFWTALFLQCLPVSGRGMADGLSEPLFLLGASAALAFASHGLRRGSPGSFALAGLCSGVAYLTRPEGLLIAALTGVVLLATQVVAAWRRPWRRTFASAGCLALGAGVMVVPYAWTIGDITVKPTAQKIVAGTGIQPPGDHRTAVHGGPLLAVWWQDGDDVNPGQRSMWGLLSLLEVLSKAFFFVFWQAALLGLWLLRGRFRQVPGFWLLALLCGVVGLLLYRVAQVMGYLSDRHTLLIVLAGSYFAMAAIDRTACWVAGQLGRIPLLAPTRWASPRCWWFGWFVAAMLLPLPRTLEPLHAERTGFREAGCWLAENTLPGDYVFDPYCWGHYFAGRVFTEGTAGLPAHRPPVYYLVFEESKNKHTRLREHQAAAKLAPHGKELRRWEVRRGKDPAAVVIYEFFGPRPPASPPTSAEPRAAAGR
jgi:hypothetical protein